MKKLLLLMAAIVLGFPAVKAQTDVSAVLGTYTGDLYVALGEEIYDADTRMEDPVSVTLAASSEAGKVDFSLPNFGFMGMTLGDIALPSIGLIEGADRYTFADNEQVRMSFLDGAIIADASLETTRSYVKGDSLVAYIPVIWLQDEENKIPIYVLFKGKREPVVDVTPALGTYSGDLYVALGEEIYDDDTRMEDPVSVTLVASSEAGKVDFSLPNFGFMGMTLGDIALPSIGLIEGTESYTFADNEQVRMSFLDGAIIADASLETTRSYVKGDSLVAYIPVIWLQDEENKIPIYVLFKGKKDVAAGIDNVAVSTTTARRAVGVYDLSGRRVAARLSETTPRGLYIVDGRKVFVR